jgi:hypothetical protein
MSRSLYLVIPDWSGEPEDAHESVVDTLRDGPLYLSIAKELWQLVGNEERLAGIRETLDKAYDRDNRDLSSEEMKHLDQLLDGLDEALQRDWLDESGLIRQELLPEVQRRTHYIDVGEHRGHLAVYGLGEALAKVHVLRDFMRRGLEKGLHLALG